MKSNVFFESTEILTAFVNGKKLLSSRGLTLSEIINGEKPCGGHGNCGKCKVKASGRLSSPCDTELRLLSKEELAAGVRLACLTRAEGDCEITTLENKKSENILSDLILPEFELSPIFSNYGAAVDIGTTTIAARLYGTNGELLSFVTALNPQSEWGADIISRIEASIGGKAEALSASIRLAVDDVLRNLAETVHIDSKHIDAAVITGNTVMLSLLTEEDVEPFSHAPFYVKRLFGEELTAKDAGLSALRSEARIYFPPCISAFVGADTTCAILTAQLSTSNVSMLVDIGTNGELALWNKGKLTVCSTAAGPAFEGVGISMGMRSSTGAVDRISLENGRLSAHVIGDTEPVGICGSGLVDAVACLLKTGHIDDSGYMECEKVTIAAPVTLSAEDIRTLQLAKSAIFAGICTLIKKENISEDTVSALYIAGGFGNYLNKESAKEIGLLPKLLAKKSITIGNAALAGASLLLLSQKKRDEAEHIAATAKTLELSNDPVFSELYISGMYFSS